MNREIRKTADGSQTLFVPALNESYHSMHGAIAESMHVYINAGLSYAENIFDEIKLLEVGLGTGLNLYLTFLNTNKKVEYTAIEPFPLDIDFVLRINPGIIDLELEKKIHTAEYDRLHSLSDFFSLLKLNKKVEDVTLKPFTYNVVYFDAFAPDVQPELWTDKIFSNLYNSMQTNAVLVTYCCKGDVRRALKSVGFVTEKLPGPPGKREMLRAIKK